MSSQKGNGKKCERKKERGKLILALVKEFDQLYKTERDCQEKINRLLYPEGDYFCRECNSKNVEYEYGERTVKCLKCKKVTSLTTHTFFHKVHSARAYLAPIWLMEQGLLLNASEIAKVSRVVNSTGQLILKKICFVVKDRLSEIVSYATSEQLEYVICKRSKETRRRLHPRSEVVDAKEIEDLNSNKQKNTDEDESLIPDRESKVEGRTFKETCGIIVFDNIEKQVLKVLTDTPLQLESLQNKVKIPTPSLLPALTMLELKGFITRFSGDLFINNLSSTIATVTGKKVLDQSHQRRAKSNGDETVGGGIAVIELKKQFNS